MPASGEPAASEPELLVAVHMDKLLGKMLGRPAEVRRVGRYRVLDVLGQGGMGTLFEARDERTERSVILELLDTQWVPRDTARLRREAEALVKLSHPNVVPVYEVGEDDGQWFVAMEHRAGQTLRQWQNARHPWTECVQVYLQAIAGLAAAHDEGLVHRGFRPERCTVDDRGRVRVMGFGLGRAGVPGAGSKGEAVAVPEDPRYLPLEQLQGGPADARSDQFSVCAALYEALYGEPPFGEGAAGAVGLGQMSGRLHSPSPGTPVPARVRRVVLRGLSAVPEERWPSMVVLGVELRRVLEPRRWRWRWWGLGLAVVGAGVLAMRGLVTDDCGHAEDQLSGVWDEARAQAVDAAISGTTLDHAADTRSRVRDRLDAYGRAWTDEYTDACEATVVRGAQSQGIMALRMGCLSDRRASLRARVDTLAAADAAVVERAVELVASLPSLAACRDVKRLQRRAQSMPSPENPAVAQRVARLRDELRVIEATRVVGRYREALSSAEAAVERAGALGYAPLVAEARLHRDRLLGDAGRYVDAERALRRTHALATEHHHERVEYEAALGLVLVVGDRLARPTEGLRWADLALPAAQRLGEAIEMAAVHSVRGSVFERQGRWGDAAASHRQALEIWQRAVGEGHPLIATGANDLGRALVSQGHYDQAEAQYRRAQRIWERALGAEHPNIAVSLENLGTLRARQGKHGEAEALYRRALKLRERALGPEHPARAQSWVGLGTLLTELGRPDEAIALYRKAVALRERTLGPGHPDLAPALVGLGTVLHRQGQPTQARARYREAREILGRAVGPEHPELAQVDRWLRQHPAPTTTDGLGVSTQPIRDSSFPSDQQTSP